MNETLEFKFTTKSGKAVWTNLAASPLMDNKGQYVGALAMVTDITKRKLSQESLKQSEANIRNIFDNTAIAYVLLDPAFNIISFNEVAAISYRKELGRVLEQGKCFLDYFTGKRRINLETHCRGTLRGERISYEVYSTSAEKSVNWFNVQLSPVIDSTQKTLGLVIAVTDITERKESELQRDKMTADIVQRNKDLEQFAYIVSHNLRAPVANILGISKVLEFPNLCKEERSEIEQGISTSAQKLDEVIIDLNHILQVKRDVSEKKEIVRFSSIVSDIKASIADLIEREKVEIVTDFVAIDEYCTLKSYLYSILYNLISNSIKYRRKEINPVIHIRSLLRKNDVELRLVDNGIGIDLTKYKDKVFGLYKRFHSIETEGKGMGLYMVKTQVETLGRKIDVKSTINRGTEFIINLVLTNEEI
jgi:PAS domain S-box-containing protein